MFYRFSSVIRDKLVCLNVAEKGVRTIHKAKVYTSFLRLEQGVGHIHRWVLYTRNNGTVIIIFIKLLLIKRH